MSKWTLAINIAATVGWLYGGYRAMTILWPIDGLLAACIAVAVACAIKYAWVSSP